MRLGDASYGLTCGPATARMAGRGLTQPGICGRWLPVWPSGFSLATLTSAAGALPRPDRGVGGRAPAASRDGSVVRSMD